MGVTVRKEDGEGGGSFSIFETSTFNIVYRHHEATGSFFEHEITHFSMLYKTFHFAMVFKNKPC